MRVIEDATRGPSAAPSQHPVYPRGGQVWSEHTVRWTDVFVSQTSEAARPQGVPAVALPRDQVAASGRRKLYDSSNQAGYTAIVVVLVVIASLFLIALAIACIHQACKRKGGRAPGAGSRPIPAPPCPAGIELNPGAAGSPHGPSARTGR